MAIEIFPPAVMDYFTRICGMIGGRAAGANMVLDSPGVLVDPDQATVVREGTAHTAGLDVMVGSNLYGRANPINYHLDGLPAEVIEELAPPGGVPAAMAMLLMHEIGHITIHPAGTSDYKAQMEMLLVPQGIQSRLMNILSDLILNHNVMHGTNVRNASNDEILRIRRQAVLGLASLYLSPSCGHTEDHKLLVAAGSLPNTHYQPTNPCTAVSDPDPDGNVVQCGLYGTVHDRGCFDNHYVDFTAPDNPDNFKVPGPRTPPWQPETGHGRSPQMYPTLTQAVASDLDERFRRVAFDPLPRSNPKYVSEIKFHNCHDCGNVWYVDDSVYQDVSDGGFESPELRFSTGSECPGRVPWDRTCGSSNISSWSLAAGTQFVVTGTRTFDNRPTTSDGLLGLEPIWCVEMDAMTPGLTRIGGVSHPVAKIGMSYVNHLCPDCGKNLESLYGMGIFGAWRNTSSHRGLQPEGLIRAQFDPNPRSYVNSVTSQVYFQQLQMQQWASIYATMSDIFPQLRLLNRNNNRVVVGIPSARYWIKLFGVDAARNNRGF